MKALIATLAVWVKVITDSMFMLYLISVVGGFILGWNLDKLTDNIKTLFKNRG